MEDEDTTIEGDSLRDYTPTQELLPESSLAQLSLHALSGHLAPETLRLKGFINDHSINILIDGGSTHNFLHNRVVLNLGLKSTKTAPLRVTVGNGEEIHCNQLCTAVQV